MSHKIEEHDRGVVWGTTWHHLTQYKEQDKPVSKEQAREVLDYPLEKVQLYRKDKFSGTWDKAVEGAFCIIRPDINQVMVPMVGNRFEVVPNTDLLDFVEKTLLEDNPALEIESVGTLRSGATSFVNIKIMDWHIPGDASQNVSRLMYYNPLGEGCYRVLAHNIRVVCNNTLQLATQEGRSNKTLTNIRHTFSAGQKIRDKLINLAEINHGFVNWIEVMERWSKDSVNNAKLKEFLDKYLPLPEEKGRSYSIVENKRTRIASKFDIGDAALTNARYSKYGLLQAVTFTLDHLEPGSKKDQADVAWDGIVGNRADQKNTALTLIGKL